MRAKSGNTRLLGSWLSISYVERSDMDILVDILNLSSIFTVQVLRWRLHESVVSRAAGWRVILGLSLLPKHRTAISVKCLQVESSGRRSRDSVVHVLRFYR